MIWVVFALMTGIAVLCVLSPLGQARARRGRGDADAAVYRAQLAEVERDAARGLIIPAEVEPTRVEVARRFLAANDRQARDADTPATGGRKHRMAAALFCVAAIPMIALGVYLRLGSPEVHDEPLAARRAANGTDMNIDVAVASIEAHLAAHPEDGKGWEVIAPVYASMGRWQEAVHAYHEAILILGSTPQRQEAYGEARVQAARGAVDDDALVAFQAVLKADPNSPKARFFTGLATEQRGEISKAIAIYGKLVADFPGMPWVKVIRARIEALRRGGVAAVASAAPKDQDAMIRDMVASLAARLAQNGKDADGWLQLVRSYVVLKEREKARTALAHAHKALAGDGPALARLDDLARELGIGGT